MHYSWLAFAREARTCRMLVASMARRAADLATAAGRPEQAEEALVHGPSAGADRRSRCGATACGCWPDMRPDRLDPAITEMYSVLEQPRGQARP